MIQRGGDGSLTLPGNFACELPGREQSNQRAELLVIVIALRRDSRHLEVRSDSQYCCSGAWAWESWCAHGWRGENKDLWALFSEAMRARGAVATVFVKVKGHATVEDVTRGRVLEADEHGNDGADALACTGADTHRVPAAAEAEATLQKMAAVHVHRMMLDILRARRATEGAAAGTLADASEQMEVQHAQVVLDAAADEDGTADGAQGAAAAAAAAAAGAAADVGGHVV